MVDSTNRSSFMAGGNLVCMHGLYYSTHGGWWEWAPPCFHFRMPYWPHMKTWLKYTERMSYLLSQGEHVCDIALMYPTESMQAYPDMTADTTFNLAMKLSAAGLDYDFIDFRSLRQASFDKSSLHIMNEKYKVMVIAGMKAMHFSSLQNLGIITGLVALFWQQGSYPLLVVEKVNKIRRSTK